MYDIIFSWHNLLRLLNLFAQTIANLYPPKGTTGMDPQQHDPSPPPCGGPRLHNSEPTLILVPLGLSATSVPRSHCLDLRCINPLSPPRIVACVFAPCNVLRQRFPPPRLLDTSHGGRKLSCKPKAEASNPPSREQHRYTVTIQHCFK